MQDVLLALEPVGQKSGVGEAGAPQCEGLMGISAVQPAHSLNCCLCIACALRCLRPCEQQDVEQDVDIELLAGEAKGGYSDRIARRSRATLCRLVPARAQQAR